MQKCNGAVRDSGPVAISLPAMPSQKNCAVFRAFMSASLGGMRQAIRWQFPAHFAWEEDDSLDLGCLLPWNNPWKSYQVVTFAASEKGG